MPDENKEVMLKVESKLECGYFKVVGRVCMWDDDRHKVVWPDHQSEYDGLMVNSTSSRDLSSSPSYGWDVEYRDVYTVDLRRAEMMVRVLRRASKAIDRLNDQFGYAATFGAYVLRAAKALGVKRFMLPSIHEPDETRIVGATTAQAIIDQWIADYHEGNGAAVA